MKKLENKVVLITGAASGLGKAIAETFAEEGAILILTDVNEEALNKVGQELKDRTSGIAVFKLDVTDEQRWIAVIDETLNRFGKLHVVVNNAGIGLRGTIETTTYEDWKKMMDINLNSVFLGTKYGVQAMLKTNSPGSVINMSSAAGLVGVADQVAYCTTKGGIRLLSKSAALHLATKNIRVNSLHPGFIETPLNKTIPNHEEQLKSIPMGHLGDAVDIGRMALFLACDDSKYCTGSEFVADGGYTAR